MGDMEIPAWMLSSWGDYMPRMAVSPNSGTWSAHANDYITTTTIGESDTEALRKSVEALGVQMESMRAAVDQALVAVNDLSAQIPTKDKLQERIGELEDFIQNLTEALTQADADRDRMRDRLAELETKETK